MISTTFCPLRKKSYHSYWQWAKSSRKFTFYPSFPLWRRLTGFGQSKKNQSVFTIQNIKHHLHHPVFEQKNKWVLKQIFFFPSENLKGSQDCRPLRKYQLQDKNYLN